MPAQQRIDRGRDTGIRHERHIDIGQAFERLEPDLERGCGAGGCQRQRGRLGACGIEEMQPICPIGTVETTARGSARGQTKDFPMRMFHGTALSEISIGVDRQLRPYGVNGFLRHF
jgi:hypothetical protein